MPLAPGPVSFVFRPGWCCPPTCRLLEVDFLAVGGKIPPNTSGGTVVFLNDIQGHKPDYFNLAFLSTTD